VGSKRLSLAQQAGISEKSLERLENGVRCKQGSLRESLPVALGQRERCLPWRAIYSHDGKKPLKPLPRHSETGTTRHVTIEACFGSLMKRDMAPSVGNVGGRLLFDDTQFQKLMHIRCGSVPSSRN